MAEAAELLDAAQAVEVAAAAALDVPADQSAPLPPQAAAAAATKATASDDVESGKLAGSLPAADAGAADAAGKAARPSALHRLAANPYLSSLGILLLLASPLPLLKLTLDACWTVARAVPALLTSGRAWREGARLAGVLSGAQPAVAGLRLRACRLSPPRSDPLPAALACRPCRAALGNRLVQYGLKYWIALTGTVIVIIALEWKVGGDASGVAAQAAQGGAMPPLGCAWPVCMAGGADPASALLGLPPARPRRRSRTARARCRTRTSRPTTLW